MLRLKIVPKLILYKFLLGKAKAVLELNKLLYWKKIWRPYLLDVCTTRTEYSKLRTTVPTSTKKHNITEPPGRLFYQQFNAVNTKRQFILRWHK